MSTNIEQSYIDGFNNNIHILAQQKTSKLMGAVRMERRKGEVDFFERLGTGVLTQKVGRYPDSPVHTLEHSRRALFYTDYQYYPMLDKQEDQRMLINPRSSYVMNGASAVGRKIDEIILSNARGTAYGGHTGATSVSFTAANQIAHGSTGLTVAKLRQAKEILGAEHADDDDLFIALSSYEVSDLLNETQVGSADYNNVRPLVDGEVSRFMGFNMIRVADSILPASGTTTYIMAWVRNGLLLGMGDYDTRIVERADKSGAWQVQLDVALGATRMEEAKVVEIAVDRS